MIKISLTLHKLCEILITSSYLKYTSQDSHKDKQNNEDVPRKTAHSTANVSYFLVFLCSWSCYHLAFGTDASSQTVLLKSPSILSATNYTSLHGHLSLSQGSYPSPLPGPLQLLSLASLLTAHSPGGGFAFCCTWSHEFLPPSFHSLSHPAQTQTVSLF